jgi:hypothetical protein
MRLLMAALCCTIFSTLTQAHDFTVPGTSGRNWVDTHLDIAPGTLLQLTATGRVDVGFGWGTDSMGGPGGTTQFANVPGYPAETRLRYGLNARLTASRTSPEDDTREDWTYGDSPQHCAEQGGHLWLTVNDDAPANNSGAFMVHLELTPCPGQPEHGRFRVTLRSFRVNVATVDGLLTGDGQGDEVYAATQVAELSSTGSILGARSLESLTYGDTSADHSLPGRIRAGAIQPSGGLLSNDRYPGRGDLPPMNNARAIPMILWEGELIGGPNPNTVVLLPTIWEADNDRVMFDDWRAQAPGFIRAFATRCSLTCRLATPLVTNSDFLVETVARNDFDHPVGIQGDAFIPLAPGRATFAPWRVVLTFNTAQRIATTTFDQLPGVFPVTYQDGPRYGSGSYTLFLRVERLP